MSLKTAKKISTRHVRRLAKTMGLKRRGLFREQAVRDALLLELQSSGMCLGYRAMTSRLYSKYGIYACRKKVAELLKELDPEGVSGRRNHRLSRRVYINNGPNFLIHIDGYDKLKRYGFAIHGGICGIERWWRSEKEGGLQYWIDFFKDKESEGIISTNNPSQLDCLRFCFTKLIQSDLNQCRQEWNQHKVRTSRNAAVSGGKPDIMFFSPELYGTLDYKIEVSLVDIDLITEQCEFPGENGCDRETERQCVECLRNRQEMPKNANEAIDLFQILIMNLDV